MNQKDFEELLKKALEEQEDLSADKAENEESENEMDPEEKENLERALDILKMGTMMELGKVAQDRTILIIDNLISDLNALNRSSKASYVAAASVKIRKAERELDILRTIVSTSTIAGGAKLTGLESDNNKILDLIMKLGSM